MKKTTHFGTILLLLFGLFANAQTIVWTGATSDNNFFTEGNWKDAVSNAIPAANTINPGANINLILQINSAATIITSGAIQFGTGSLEIGSATVTATSISGGSVTINASAYLELSSATPFLNNVQIDFTSGIGWIKTINYLTETIHANNLGQIKVNNAPAIYQTNLRLDHYYEKGCIIRANLASTTPLTVYDNSSLGGASALITINTIHSDTNIAGNMNNNIGSFVLKKGFMVTLADEIDGTGKSANYIASESDLTINTLPFTLRNSISFIRVTPWNWVTKKGRNVITDTAINTTWRYQWNPNDSSTLEHEFAPMTWGHGSADDVSDINLLTGKYNSPYVMSFNEPDDCFAQSGQYGTPKLCTISQAVKLHKNLMKTGMRLVSPGGREEAPKDGEWLESFMNEAKEQDVRIDVIAVHWYDWGGNPTVNTNPTAASVAKRFLDYLTLVHNKYGLPIWITEFNANPARSQAINAAFLAIVLPELEKLDYVERYCWFPFNVGTHFSGWDAVTKKETDKILGPVGTIYKNINNTTPIESSPSVPEATVSAGNSLNLNDFPNVAINKPVTASSSYTTYAPTNAVDGDTTTTPSRWLVEFSTKPLPAWIEIDLQGSFVIDSFRIFEETSTVKDFVFEVWDLSLNAGAGGWVSALAVTANPATPLTTFKRFTAVETTKVRLYITAHNVAGYLRMFELEVYGVPSSPIWVGATSTNWTNVLNWSTKTIPNQFSNVTIPSGAIFQPTITSSRTIKTLTINPGATLTVATGINLTVKDVIRNSGTMTIANNSNLLQDDAFNNSGNIIIKRNNSPLSRLDYSLWSSPVTNANQFLTTFSPETSLNRFYNYNQFSNLYNVVVSPSTTPFAIAAGYLIRMPNTAVTAPTTETYAGVFTGVPNNGVITKTLNYRDVTPADYGYNLLGNPYPSTIDANTFITTNTAKIQPSLYFWRKINAATGSAYAVYNSLGSTASSSGPVPNGTIQVGQGFFVKAKRQTEIDRYFVTFNNLMRTGTASTQFFKTKQLTKDRLWLNLTTTTGVFSQALIGYIAEGTIGIDDLDSEYINDSPIALTSKITDGEYSIQSRPTFDPSDVISLNFKTDVAGDYTIALDHFDGTFATGQDVYLMDSKTGIETDLKATAYSFITAAGIDNARFSLKYQKTLKIDAPAFNENSVRVYKNNGTLYVNSGTVAINNIKVFDIQGRLIAEQKNVKATTAAIKDLKATNQVLIVKITGEDANVVSKKVVN